MTDLVQLTEKAFAANGPLAQALKERDRPYAVNQKQIEYSILVAKALLGDGDLRGITTLLEGETGVGKTLGYLVPACLHLAINQKRGLISTYTLHLQHQIVNREFDVAAAVAKVLTGVSLTIAPQKGRRNFISVTRVREMEIALKEAGQLDDETKAAFDSLSGLESGDLLEWLETNELPPKVKAQDICLLPGASDEDSAAYKAHIETGKDADILVVTHALLMHSCMRWNAMLGTGTNGLPRFDVSIIDEADRIPSAAESVFNSRVSVPMVEKISENLGRFGFNGLTKITADWREWMEGQYTKLTSSYGGVFHREGSGGFVILGDPRAEAMQSEARDIAALIATQLRKGAAQAVRKGMPAEDAAEINGLAKELEEFVTSCDNPRSKYSTPILRWSPIKTFGAFSLAPLWPGHLAARLWSSRKNSDPYLRSIVMTSATLDAPGATAGGFFGFRDDVGIRWSAKPPKEGFSWDNYNDLGSASISPDKFGLMQFVFADRKVPTPRDGVPDGSDSSNPEWIRYAAQGIAAAKSRGGRSLCLLPSYRDVEVIAEEARKLGVNVIEHRRGQRLIDLLPAFLADSNGVLITPAGWEGIDLPGQLQHVIIPRVPYPMIDSAKNRALLDIFISRGYDPQKANGILFAYASANGRRKLRQGIGRAIRSVTDSATIWILDPRFPLPETITSNRRLRQSNLPKSAYLPLAKCIPDRFRNGIASTYEDAEILPYTPVLAVAAE